MNKAPLRAALITLVLTLTTLVAVGTASAGWSGPGGPTPDSIRLYVPK
jgi:hypothetical protein